MSYDPTQLDDLEMLELLALGLIPYMDEVLAGEVNPFPYPEPLLRGFNQLCLTCALRDVDRKERPKSIPEFVQVWGPLPLSEWPLKLEVLADVLTAGDKLLDPELEGRPTQVCHKLSTGIFKP